jgi:hypothetical protein
LIISRHDRVRSASTDAVLRLTAASPRALRLRLIDDLAGVQLPSASKAAIALDRASSRRGARLVVRAEEGGLPDFVKDLMKPPRRVHRRARGSGALAPGAPEGLWENTWKRAAAIDAGLTPSIVGAKG